MGETMKVRRKAEEFDVRQGPFGSAYLNVDMPLYNGAGKDEGVKSTADGRLLVDIGSLMEDPAGFLNAIGKGDMAHSIEGPAFGGGPVKFQMAADGAVEVQMDLGDVAYPADRHTGGAGGAYDLAGKVVVRSRRDTKVAGLPGISRDSVTACMAQAACDNMLLTVPKEEGQRGSTGNLNAAAVELAGMDYYSAFTEFARQHQYEGIPAVPDVDGTLGPDMSCPSLHDMGIALEEIPGIVTNRAAGLALVCVDDGEASKQLRDSDKGLKAFTNAFHEHLLDGYAYARPEGSPARELLRNSGMSLVPVENEDLGATMFQPVMEMTMRPYPEVLMNSVNMAMGVDTRDPEEVYGEDLLRASADIRSALDHPHFNRERRIEGYLDGTSHAVAAIKNHFAVLGMGAKHEYKGSGKEDGKMAENTVETDAGKHDSASIADLLGPLGKPGRLTDGQHSLFGGLRTSGAVTQPYIDVGAGGKLPLEKPPVVVESEMNVSNIPGVATTTQHTGVEGAVRKCFLDDTPKINGERGDANKFQFGVVDKVSALYNETLNNFVTRYENEGFAGYAMPGSDERTGAIPSLKSMGISVVRVPLESFGSPSEPIKDIYGRVSYQGFSLVCTDNSEGAVKARETGLKAFSDAFASELRSAGRSKFSSRSEENRLIQKLGLSLSERNHEGIGGTVIQPSVRMTVTESDGRTYEISRAAVDDAERQRQEERERRAAGKGSMVHVYDPGQALLDRAVEEGSRYMAERASKRVKEGLAERGLAPVYTKEPVKLFGAVDFKPLSEGESRIAHAALEPADQKLEEKFDTYAPAAGNLTSTAKELTMEQVPASGASVTTAYADERADGTKTASSGQAPYEPLTVRMPAMDFVKSMPNRANIRALEGNKNLVSYLTLPLYDGQDHKDDGFQSGRVSVNFGTMSNVPQSILDAMGAKQAEPCAHAGATPGGTPVSVRAVEGENGKQVEIAIDTRGFADAMNKDRKEMLRERGLDEQDIAIRTQHTSDRIPVSMRAVNQAYGLPGMCPESVKRNLAGICACDTVLAGNVRTPVATFGAMERAGEIFGRDFMALATFHAKCGSLGTVSYEPDGTLRRDGSGHPMTVPGTKHCSMAEMGIAPIELPQGGVVLACIDNGPEAKARREGPEGLSAFAKSFQVHLSDMARRERDLKSRDSDITANLLNRMSVDIYPVTDKDSGLTFFQPAISVTSAPKAKALENSVRAALGEYGDDADHRLGSRTVEEARDIGSRYQEEEILSKVTGRTGQASAKKDALEAVKSALASEGLEPKCISSMDRDRSDGSGDRGIV